ncbi:hypothetical protein CHUAL_008884 [Chamberlinius hualienensis]
MLYVVLTLLKIFSAIENTIQQGPDELLVTIPNGQIRGITMTSENGRNYLAFRGIPYGEPTNKDLRFAPPVARGKWNGVWDATKDGQMCVQFAVLRQQYDGDEDCLLLNVYIPETRNKTKLLPVIYYIHGGAFVMGSGRSDEIGPEKMMDYDAILVVVNYRVGPFGFLSTGDAASPGNYALLDQVLALKWVRDNIQAFGGDPTKVTLTGTSAGSWAVMLHMVSPLSKGLFHGAIAQSGCPFSKWGNSFDSMINIEALESLLNCPGNNQEAIDCFRQRSDLDIVQKSNGLDNFLELIANVRFHAVSDSVRGKDSFLPDQPAKLLESGATVNKVPLFIGLTTYDGAFLYDSSSFLYNSTGSDHLYNVIPLMLRKMLGLSEEASKTLHQAIIQEYFSDGETDELLIARRISRVYSDMAFDYCTDKTIAKLTSIGVPVYAYRFSYSKGSFDFLGFNKTYDYKAADHVDHGEDFTYQFNNPLMPAYDEWSKFGPEDNRISKMYCELWTNFANDLVPTTGEIPFPWEQSKPDQPVYMNISSEPGMVSGPFCTHTPFWMENLDKLE